MRRVAVLAVTLAVSACAHRAHISGREPAVAVPDDVRAGAHFYEGPSVRYYLVERPSAPEVWTEGIETCTNQPSPPARLTRYESTKGTDVFIQWSDDEVWRMVLVFPRDRTTDAQATIFERGRVLRQWPVWARGLRP